MKLVLDTNVIVAAMRSPSGASAELVRMARAGKIRIAANVALALEYEAVCTLAEHYVAAALSREEATIFVDAVIAMCEPVETAFMWRPQLRDPADELVLEAAVNGGASAIVTFNRRDFGEAPAMFGVHVWLPSETLKRIER